MYLYGLLDFFYINLNIFQSNSFFSFINMRNYAICRSFEKLNCQLLHHLHFLFLRFAVIFFKTFHHSFLTEQTMLTLLASANKSSYGLQEPFHFYIPLSNIYCSLKLFHFKIILFIAFDTMR